MIKEKYFIIDDKIITYNDLFVRIRKDVEIFSIWQYTSVSEFVINLIKALFHDIDIVILDADFSEKELNDLGFIYPIEAKVPVRLNHDIKDDDIIQKVKISKSKITMFTSGTTGVPKKITHTVSSLTRMIRSGNKYRENVWALVYNPTHMAGLQVIMQALFNNNTIVNLFGKDSGLVDDIINKYMVSHISATPTFYKIVTATSRQLFQVERITLGGEKFDDNLRQKIQEKFPNAKINNIYASTEIGSLLVSDGSIFKIPEHLRTLVKIENNELLVHSSLLANETNIINDWFQTGDIVEYIDTENFRFIRRENNTINIGGYKVCPEEVEEAILQIENVINVRVFAKDNSVTGKILCAEIISKVEFDSKFIREALKISLQDFKIPRIIKRVEKIETTRNGKIKRSR